MAEQYVTFANTFKYYVFVWLNTYNRNNVCFPDINVIKMTTDQISNIAADIKLCKIMSVL
jgi:hypothetical protein